MHGFSLSAYTILSAAYIDTIHAQVIYTDIDPDIILDSTWENTSLDIDENGGFDFSFFNYSFSFYDSYCGWYKTVEDLLAMPINEENYFAGREGYEGTCNGGGFARYYPFALVAADIINNELAWQNFSFQLMAINEIYPTLGVSGSSDICDDCDWFYFMSPDILDHYLGIRFKDEAAQTHYGWIRCSVLDTGRTLIIHDYAYETQPDHPILAGDTTHYVAVNEAENTLQAVVYSYAKNIYIKITEQNIMLTVFDITGKQIHTEKIQSTVTQVNMQLFSAGVYVVELRNNEKVYRKKVLIE